MNPGLGLSLSLPPGLAFDKVDAVWPDRTLLSLSGPGGTVVIAEDELDPSLAPAQALRAALKRPCTQRRIAGRPGCAARDGFAVADGATLYVVEARGPEAARLIASTARRFELR